MGTSESGATEQKLQPRQASFTIDGHYTARELEWNRLVGSNGIGIDLLQTMSQLSRDIFDIEGIERVAMSDGERFSFTVNGHRHVVTIDSNVPFSSTLRHGLRHFFNQVNAALRRTGVDWRFVCIRNPGSPQGIDHRIVLLPCARLVEECERQRVVAGWDVNDVEVF